VPALQQGETYQLRNGRYGIRYRDATGRHRETQDGKGFSSPSAARRWLRDHEAATARGHSHANPDTTLAEFIPIYLQRHAPGRRPRTITDLRKRLAHQRELKPGETCTCATCTFGAIPLRELERMSGEIADWQANLPERSRYGIVGALRQTLGAAERWGHIDRNPAKLAGRNPQPPPRTVRAYTRTEIDAISLELSAIYEPLPAVAAATGLRPEEWQAVERRDIDRRSGVLNVRRTVSSGEIVELGKTSRSRRQVPLTRRALAALDRIPAQLQTRLLFPAPDGGLLDLDNFRRREWQPAIQAAAIPTPARIYDLRSTFATDALAAGITVFDLTRIMGTSVHMIERHYGTLLDGAAEHIADRLDRLDSTRDNTAEEDTR